MARIYFSKLNPKLKENILNRQYSLAEMEQIRGQMSQLMKTRTGGFHLVIIIAIVCMAITMLPIMMQSGMTAVVWAVIGIMAAVIALVMLFTWLGGAGYLRYQYNRAVKQAYPEHADMLML